MSSTEQFQQQTANALRDANANCPAQVLQQSDNHQSRRFNIYRNNRAVSLIENLKACYPAIYQLLGADFFNASAREYINLHPPKNPVMAEYGESFGKFVGQLPGTAKFPFIADVARLEWAHLQAYHQADADPLTIDALSKVAPENLAHLKLGTHPTLFLIESRWSVGSMWAATVNQRPTPDTFDVSAPERILILRPHLDVTTNLIDEPTAAFVGSLHQGESIENAAQNALQHDPDFNPGTQLQQLFGMGAVCSYTEQH